MINLNNIKLPFQKKLFGNNIEPKCEYCCFSRVKDDGTILCYSGSTPQEGGCKKFKYDPLKREPNKLPSSEILARRLYVIIKFWA